MQRPTGSRSRPRTQTAIRLPAVPHRLVGIAFLLFVAAWAIGNPAAAIELGRNLLIFSTILTLVVGFHEFCHLLAAVALGIKPKEFGLAFGPELLGRTAFGIRWRINAIPIGGYVKLVGEDSDEGPNSFATAPAWKKVVILLVGPVSNLVLAVVILMALAGVMRPSFGIPQMFQFAQAVLGLIATSTVDAIAAFLPHAAQAPLDMPVMGIPGMVQASGTMLGFGPEMVVVLAAAISFSMGIVNILPIPPLDGGQALFAVLKGLLGRFYPERAMRYATLVGLGFLVALMATINGIDLIRTFLGITPPGT